MLVRSRYIAKIKPFVGLDVVKVITGIRRSGKSVLLQQIQDEIAKRVDPNGVFVGIAAMAPLSRLIAELPQEKRQEIYKTYRQRFFEGCGKSLACRNICPAGIDVDALLVNSNAIAVWKRFFRK